LKVGGKLLPKQCEQQCQDDADDDRGGDWKVESKFLFFNDDVAREFADPGYLLAHEQKNSDGNNEKRQLR